MSDLASDSSRRPAQARRILLADADAFYVSVARLVDPAGAGRAPLLIVGGSAEGRGVVMSASYEARAYGVRSALPMARALRLCPGATVVPVPWKACSQKGRDIRLVLERFTPTVQQASSDEFYLDMSGTERLYHDEPLGETARRMRAAVLAKTGLSLSIGGGSSRLVAKLAAEVAKPGAGADRAGDGVYIVPGGEEIAFMRRFALADIPGIGPKTAQRLEGRGLRTVEDVLALDRAALAARLGVGHKREAEWLYRRVRGLDSARVEPHAGAKSISRDETFGRDLDADDALARELARLVDRATEDLRESRLMARTITVKLRDWDFRTRQASRTLAEPVISDRVAYDVAGGLLAKLRAARRVPARLIGVALSGLVRQDRVAQLDLLPQDSGCELETTRDRTIARAMDEVRDRFGRRALGRGLR